MPAAAPVWVVYPSSRAGKKWAACGSAGPGNRRVTVHFGAQGYSDYPTHRDAARKARYIRRHAARERWGRSGVGTPGFWSRWLLWNLPTLRGSAADMGRRFGIRVRFASRAAN